MRSIPIPFEIGDVFWVAIPSVKDCEYCDGLGSVEVKIRKKKFRITCPACNGLGTSNNNRSLIAFPTVVETFSLTVSPARNIPEEIAKEVAADQISRDFVIRMGLLPVLPKGALYPGTNRLITTKVYDPIMHVSCTERGKFVANTNPNNLFVSLDDLNRVLGGSRSISVVSPDETQKVLDDVTRKIRGGCGLLRAASMLLEIPVELNVDPITGASVG